VQVGVGHECQEARALDRRRHLALILGLGAGQAGRHDLAVFLDEILHYIQVLVIDLLDLLRGKAAKLFALEKACRLFALALHILALALAFAFAATTHGTWHVFSPIYCCAWGSVTRHALFP